jgi:RNA polymerase sigma factor (sigma-70 family)
VSLPLLSSDAAETADHGTLLRAGSPDGIALIYNANVDELMAYFFRRTYDAEVAADLTSETFAKMLANRAQYDADRGSVRQWLYGIAKNELREFWRRKQVSTAAQDKLGMERQRVDDQLANELGAAEQVVGKQVVVDAIGKLGTRYRQPVALRVLQDMSYEQIASELGCTAGSARVRVFRGLKKLEGAFRAA